MKHTVDSQRSERGRARPTGAGECVQCGERLRGQCPAGHCGACEAELVAARTAIHTLVDSARGVTREAAQAL